MVDGPIDAADPEFVRLKSVKAKREAGQSALQASLEIDASRIYDEFTITVNGEPHALRFRRFTHGQGNMLVTLSFYDKLIRREALTDEELARLVKVKKQMVGLALVDCDAKFFTSNDQIAIVVYNLIAAASGMTEEFDKSLYDFYGSDRGFGYGWFWFHEMHLLPSQVALLPETDVKAVNAWAGKWAERVGK